MCIEGLTGEMEYGVGKHTIVDETGPIFEDVFLRVGSRSKPKFLNASIRVIRGVAEENIHGMIGKYS